MLFYGSVDTLKVGGICRVWRAFLALIRRCIWQVNGRLSDWICLKSIVLMAPPK